MRFFRRSEVDDVFERYKRQMQPGQTPGKYESLQPKNGRLEWSAENNQTWASLYPQLCETWKEHGISSINEGVEYFDFPEDRVPQPIEIHRKLAEDTDKEWGIRTIPGMLSSKDFYTELSQGHAPFTSFMRNSDDQGHSEEADCTHDITHILLLHDPKYQKVMKEFSEVYLETESQAQRKYLTRLWWHTVETGLMKESGEIKVFGAAILSSHEETKHAVETAEKHQKFDLDQALKTPIVDITKIQDQYFVLDDLEVLLDVIRDKDTLMEKINLAIDERRSHSGEEMLFAA